MQHTSLKNYTFIVLPDERARLEAEALRFKHIGRYLVDGLPPHITLKKRFSLVKEASENYLKNILADFNILKLKVTASKPQRLDDAVVLLINSDELSAKRRELLKLLEKTTTSKNLSFENDDYKIHLTLLRDPGRVHDVGAIHWENKEITLKAFCLYEIDPSPDKSLAREIACKNLTG